MLVAKFRQSTVHTKAKYILTTMNEELHAASVLFVQSGAFLVKDDRKQNTLSSLL